MVADPAVVLVLVVVVVPGPVVPVAGVVAGRVAPARSEAGVRAERKVSVVVRSRVARRYESC